MLAHGLLTRRTLPHVNTSQCVTISVLIKSFENKFSRSLTPETIIGIMIVLGFMASLLCSKCSTLRVISNSGRIPQHPMDAICQLRGSLPSVPVRARSLSPAPQSTIKPQAFGYLYGACLAFGWLARPGLLSTPLRSLPLESGKLVSMWTVSIYLSKSMCICNFP